MHPLGIEEVEHTSLYLWTLPGFNKRSQNNKSIIKTLTEGRSSMEKTPKQIAGELTESRQLLIDKGKRIRK